tara:strand:+ start:496 stop:2451 length:1956 start_codon:yes stop_codon:yes gene_type:complete
MASDDEHKVYVLLMTGIENGSPPASSEDQFKLFLNGYGEDERLEYYSNKEINQLKSAIEKYPNVPIVLFSDAGKYALTLSNFVSDKSLIHVVEPWLGSSTQLDNAKKAVANGIPSTNYYVGSKNWVGFGIPNASKTPKGQTNPGGLNHLSALTYIGQVIKTKYPPPPPEPITQKIDFIGNIIDSGTKDNLPGVNVEINQNGNSIDKGFEVDINGSFEIVENLSVGTYEFTFSLTGYNSKSITKQVLATTLQLNFETIELEEKKETPSEPEIISSEVRGKVVDDKNNPISGATIKSLLDNSNTTTSETTGDFILVVDYNQDNIPFSIDVSAEGFGSKSVSIFNGPPDNIIKKNITVTKLSPIQVDLKDTIDAELPLPDPQVKAIKLSKTDFEVAKQQAMNQVITTVKTVLLPAILTQLAAFGIAKAQEALGKKLGDLNVTCPSNLDELNELIRKKNRLVKQLNNIFNFLRGVRIGVQAIDILLTVAEIALPIVKSTLVVPGSPSEPGQSGIKEIEKELKKYKLISSTTLITLTILISVLQQILSYLALLDQITEKCAIEGALTQEQLTNDLLASTQTQSNQLSPVVTNINGFEMGVINVDNVTVGGLKRRRAVARNKQGVIMLEGEPSFSSIDQILIDELVFYIQQNDLKAE